MTETTDFVKGAKAMHRIIMRELRHKQTAPGLKADYKHWLKNLTAEISYITPPEEL